MKPTPAKDGAKIFLFDIETSPITGNFWGMWKQNIPVQMHTLDWQMLTWAGKWLGSDEILYDSNHLHGTPFDDKGILESLHTCIDEADIIVAHNGNKFDMKKMNARFILQGMQPPSPVRKIDTLLEARKNFAFTSNRLDALGHLLGVGRKVETGGYALWEGCLKGDVESFETMLEYNIGDVTLLEDVYLKLRPWMNQHPNINVFTEDEEPACPKCGGTHLNYRGYASTQMAKYRRFQCMDCGGWGRDRVHMLDKAKSRSLKNGIA